MAGGRREFRRTESSEPGDDHLLPECPAYAWRPEDRNPRSAGETGGHGFAGKETRIESSDVVDETEGTESTSGGDCVIRRGTGAEGASRHVQGEDDEG